MRPIASSGMLRRYSIIIAAFSSSLTAGCAQSDCEAVCEAAKDCQTDGEVGQVFASLDCGDACDFQEDQSAQAGCSAELDTFHACGADNLDRACEANVCSEEALSWSQCLDMAEN